jgi:hypothetical protein
MWDFNAESRKQKAETYGFRTFPFLSIKGERNAPKFAKNCYLLEMIEGRKAYPPQKPTVSAPSLYIIYNESERNAPKFAKNCYPLEIIEGRKAYPPLEDTT